jgi:hypothetical protein
MLYVVDADTPILVADIEGVSDLLRLLHVHREFGVEKIISSSL